MPEDADIPRFVRINLGGEGEEPDAIYVQPGRIGGLAEPAERHAFEVARRSGQPVVRASGDRLPFADGVADEVMTNDVPIDQPAETYFGPSFTTAEILRTLKGPEGRWRGTSAP